MAKVMPGQKAVRETISIEISVVIPPSGGTDITVAIDGAQQSWRSPSRVTAHAAVYAAAVIAMQAADARGVTHLTLSTRANLVRRQVTGDWSTRATQLAGAHAFYLLFRDSFEDVDWIKSASC